MNPLFLSHLFPNPEAPAYGTFVRDKVLAVARLVPARVIAPVSWFPLGRPRTAVPPEETIEGVAVCHPRYWALPDAAFAWRWRTYRAALERALARLAPTADTLLAVDWVYPDAYAALRCARAHGLKTVITVHGRNAMGYYSRSDRQPFFAAPLRQTDRVIAVSQALSADLQERHGVPPDCIRVIGNGMNPAVFRDMGRAAARRQLDLPSDRLVLVTVARLAEEKALSVLLEALTLMRRTDAHWYAIGDGPLKETLARQTAARGLTARVHLLGARPPAEVGLWLNAADAFCLPSLHEGCPVVTYEALACGLPVVATRVGGIPDQIASETYGLLCQPNDSRQLADALDRALATAWDRATIAAYGRQFTWDRVARETVTVYRELMDSVS